MACGIRLLSQQVVRSNLQRGDRNAAAGAAQEAVLAFGESLAVGKTVETFAQRCGIVHSTALRWRHRLIDAFRQDPETLRGIVEADKTYLR